MLSVVTIPFSGIRLRRDLNMLTLAKADNAIRWHAGQRLNHLFEQRCDRFRRVGKEHHLAVVTDDVALSYEELDRRSNQAAKYLIAQGIAPGDRVALLFDKSHYSYIALLAVLKANAVYVPLDISYPVKRVEFILQDAAITTIVSLSCFAATLAEFPVRKLYLDTAEADMARFSPARFSAAGRAEPEDELCYIIYTSGTTGTPKGVAIEHAGICNFVSVASEVYGYKETDRVYQGMTIAFDFSVEELWVPLVVGATLVPGRPGGCLLGDDLADFLIERRVTALCCVPTVLATIDKEVPELRFLLVSGEACPHHLVKRWHHPGRIMLNAYGPTEASVTTTLTELQPDKPVTIGRPLPTYMVVILDEHDENEVPPGAVGEIGIAGIGLAKGYLNRADLTARKFVPDFLNLTNNPSRRIYRTGDLGRRNEDGDIEFQGRIDSQVKIRGYRIELDEIESVLLQAAQIAQAVVHTYEPEPGVVELAAYYTLKPGVTHLSPVNLVQMLRQCLPAYMIPAYFVKIPSMPMSASNKVDRKALPAPTAPRSTSRRKCVLPRTKIEKCLTQAMVEVMKLDRVSLDDNFFTDLGGHSLLMARYCAEIRRRMPRSTVSMRDIYLNPTVRRLAAHLKPLADERRTESVHGATRIPTDREYFLCGALQLLFYVAYGAALLWALVGAYEWSYGADSVWQSYVRLVVISVCMFAIPTAIAIGLKWLLVGRWRPEAIPIWSLRYFRFWLVKSLVQSAPPAFFVGSPIYNLYLRLLGAKIGRHAVICSAPVPVCTDLIGIGQDTVLRKDSLVLGYKAQGNYIHTGRIDIGDGAFVGEATVLDIDTSIGKGSQLGHSSCLCSGQRIPDGRRFHGSPAQETTTDYCGVAGVNCTSLRRGTYAAAQLLTLFAVLLPLPILMVQLAAPFILGHLESGLPSGGVAPEALPSLALSALEVSAALYFGSVLIGLLGIFAVPRLCNFFLEPDRTYVIYGPHYALQRIVSSVSNSSFYNNLFGDSSAIVYYLRWIGYNLNQVVQTGSNFGSSQKQENPFLCDIGSGTMVSDAISLINMQMNASAFRLRQIRIGSDNYFGNKVHYPPDGKTGANCLFGTKVLVPIDGPLREGVGLLGSPPFEIPRIVDRDLRLREGLSAQVVQAQLRRKNRHNLVTAILFLLRNWLFFFALLFLSYIALDHYHRVGIVALWLFAAAFVLLAILYFAVIERATLGFRRLQPRFASIYDEYYWFHERHWKFCDLWFQLLFKGTPFKSLLMRLLGVRMGKKVFDDGCLFIEKTLATVGDYSNLNAGTTI